MGFKAYAVYQERSDCFLWQHLSTPMKCNSVSTPSSACHLGLQLCSVLAWVYQG